MGGLCSVALPATLVALVAFLVGVSTPHLAGEAYTTALINQTVPDKLEGLNVVITGGTSGVGFEAARILAARGANLVITGRDINRASKKAAEISDSATGMSLDNQDPKSISRFSSDLTTLLDGASLDVLVLSAGMFYPADTTSGMQRSLANGQLNDALITANHLGAFHLVVNHLMPLIEAGNTRVVVVTSVSHFLGTAASVLPAPSGTWEPLFPDGAHPGILRSFRLYGTSKLQNVLFAYKLQRELPDISVVLCTPGFVATNIGGSDRSATNKGGMEGIPLARMASDGGSVLAKAATIGSPPSGKFVVPYWLWEGVPLTGRWRGIFHNVLQEMFLQRLTPAGWLFAFDTHPASYDTGLQDAVWEWSLNQTVGW